MQKVIDNIEAGIKGGLEKARQAAMRDGEAQQKRIDTLEAALTRAQQDINWMINEEKFLNQFVFDYIEAALNPLTGPF